MAVDQGRAAAQLADFGQEFARPLPHDRHHVAQAIALRDRHDALEQHEHAGARFAGGKRRVPRANCCTLPKRAMRAISVSLRTGKVW
jgi:hypothetical protein